MDAKLRDNSKTPVIVTFRPLREEQVELPDVDEKMNNVTLKVFAMTEEGRPRKVMIPPRDARWVSTQVTMSHPLNLHPNWHTPRRLSDMGLQVLEMREDPETQEVEVRVFSTHPVDARYLDHGDPLVLIHFMPTVWPQVETW